MRTYTYDPDNRVTQIVFSSGPTISFGYDADGNSTSESDSTGSYTYHYNNLNQQTEEDKPGALVVKYGYDVNGNLNKLTDVNSNVTNYTYNKENLLSTLLEPGISTPIGFKYNADNNRTEIDYPNGVNEYLTYDDSQRITSIYAEKLPATTAISATCYTYSEAGADTDLRQTATSWTNAAWASSCASSGGTTTTYTYDTLDRLSEAATSSTVLQYAYDFNGNLCAKYQNSSPTTLSCSSSGAGITNYSFNGANETSNTGYSYDSAGNQTANSGIFSTASYNKVEQMSSVTPTGGSAIAMTYQGLGQAHRTGNGTPSQVNDQLGLEKETGTIATYFTRDAGGTTLGEIHGSPGTFSNHYYFVFDANGSVLAVTNSSGTVADSFSYAPYGATTIGSNTVYEPIRFDGGYDDTANSGEALIKFGARYYDSTTGRWTTDDPADNPLNTEGWNQYDYTGDDPINMVDIAGNCILCVSTVKKIGGVLGAVSTACGIGAAIPNPAEAALAGCAFIAGTSSAIISLTVAAKERSGKEGVGAGADAVALGCTAAAVITERVGAAVCGAVAGIVGASVGVTK